MNRPRRPFFSPPRKKKPSGAAARATAAANAPRRRSALDNVPTNADPQFQVLGTGVDRQALMTYASPTEMLVVHGFSREIDDAYSRFNGRIEDFWANNPDTLACARRIDEVLAGIVARKGPS